MENMAGEPVVFPITLDGGESKFVIARAPFGVPNNIAQIITSIPATSPPMTMSTLQAKLGDRRLDFIGNILMLRAGLGNLDRTIGGVSA
jgi:hypothetical protein